MLSVPTYNERFAELDSIVAVKDQALTDALEKLDQARTDAHQGTERDPNQQHGGWGPRTAALVAAFYKGQWNKCRELCDQYYNKYAWFGRLVDRQGTPCSTSCLKYCASNSFLA